MKKWLKENMHEPVNQLIKRLNIKLLGHYRYYGITDNSKSIGSFLFDQETIIQDAKKKVTKASIKLG